MVLSLSGSALAANTPPVLRDPDDETPAQTDEAAEPETTAAVGPNITKHPGGELVSIGGAAMFVSRADGAAEITWHLVDPQGSQVYDAARAGELFAGMSSVGQGTETLALYAIPLAFSGWQVECAFTGTDGATSVSDRAAITVSETELAAPVITSAPEDMAVQLGTAVTLGVVATPAEGCSLKYQWYQTDQNNTATMLQIPEATGNIYAPPQTEGTIYYCVEVRSVNANGVSTRALTPLIAVTYTKDPPVVVHEHEFGEEWRYDAIYHWHECSCGEHSQEAPHDFTWTETVKATARREGERIGVCSVCGYERREVIPAKSTGQPSQGLLIALLVLVIILLLAGAAWVVMKNRGKPSGRNRYTNRR